jgi:phosphate transport system permease protein
MSAIPDKGIIRSAAAEVDHSAEAKILSKRHAVGKIWQVVFASSTLVGIVALTALLLNIINSAFGYVAFENTIPPEVLAISGVPIEEMSKGDLVTVLGDHVSAGLMRRLEDEMPWEERSREDIYDLVLERVVEPKPVAQWSLFDSLFNVDEIQQEIAEKYRGADVIFRSWITLDFITSPQSSNALIAGVRTAILGSLWTIFIAISFSFPIGVGAAIYLQEYAKDNFINRIIQTNINNLAGVPSIIYGILGLALFVRLLNQFTSGAVFGFADPLTANGRTILSAGLTLGLLILPLIIINAQEAIKAVPNSLREASYGMGATRWQTVLNHVLPSALPGILTGTILAISRAIGETAPMVVIGASTFITFDPTGPFSKFTTLPIQIYQWTSRPQGVFRNIAAGAIIVLLVMLLSMNALAVLLRNKYSRRI